MLNFSKIISKPAVCRALTGMNPQEFSPLSEALETLWRSNRERLTANGKPRQRAAGAGGEPSVMDDPGVKLLFILFHVKVYCIQEVQGVFFDMDQSRVNRWIGKLLPLLEELSGQKTAFPQRKIHSVREVMGRIPQLSQVTMDGTERPIGRPKDKAKQKSHYSGKKKGHRVKNILVCKGRMAEYVGPASPGSRHDKALADEIPPPLPPDKPVRADLGFVGFKPQDAQRLLPIKKPKGRELTAEQKEYNRQHAKIRVEVEHVIGGVKISRIVADTYRGMRKGFEDLAMRAACGLHNLRVAFRLRPEACLA